MMKRTTLAEKLEAEGIEARGIEASSPPSSLPRCLDALMPCCLLLSAFCVSAFLIGCQGGADPVASGPSYAETSTWSTKDRSSLSPGESVGRIAPPKNLPQDDIVGLRSASIALLREAADSTNPLLRAHAIEALQTAPDELEPVVLRGLGDANRGVRFAAAMTVGRLKMRSLIHLIEPLLLDESESVQAASIFALRRCGEKVDPSPLSIMVMSDDPEVKANAAMVLGELGDPSALPMLRQAMRTPITRASVPRNRIVELQIAEAMVRLGAEGEFEVIRAALFAPPDQGEITAFACQILGNLGDHAYTAAMRDMAMREGRQQEPAEIRLAAAAAVAQIEAAADDGRGTGRQSLVKVPLDYVGHDQYSLRGQAAWTLGWIGMAGGGSGSLAALRGLLRDPNALVQVAAAGAILRVTSA